MSDVKKLEEAKRLYKDANADQRYVLERLFPELKECEDEWIEDYWQHHKVINHYSYDKGEEIQFDHQGFVRFCKKYCRKHAEWHAEDEQNLNACLGYLPDEFLARWLKDVIHREYDEPVWSEEDESNFKVDDTFDFGKKELNLSEKGYKRMFENCVISHQDMTCEEEVYDGEDYGIDSLWHAKNILEKTIGEVKGYQTADGILSHKCAISFIDKLYKQKHATWSEDDEKIFNRICDIIHSAAYGNCEVDENGEEQGEYARMIKWFKSIKDSVRLQNLTVTDEELSQAKKDAYNDALNKIEYHNGEPTFDDGWSAAILYLKKRNAQPQDTLKQSNEEVEQLIEEASEYLREYADHHVQGGNSKVYIHSIADGLESLYCPLAQLKSGGSRVVKRWKPSKEQMKALSKALSLARVNGEEYKFDLRTLLGDLKKLLEE